MPALNEVIHCDPEIMGGVPVFVGTRVPVKTLWDHLKAGEPLDVFLDDFPSVTREQAVATIERANDLLTESVLPGGQIPVGDFRRIANTVLKKNAELYKRLA